jgi:hypothetical protein
VATIKKTIPTKCGGDVEEWKLSGIHSIKLYNHSGKVCFLKRRNTYHMIQLFHM